VSSPTPPETISHPSPPSNKVVALRPPIQACLRLCSVEQLVAHRVMASSCTAAMLSSRPCRSVSQRTAERSYPSPAPPAMVFIACVAVIRFIAGTPSSRPSPSPLDTSSFAQPAANGNRRPPRCVLMIVVVSALHPAGNSRGFIDQIASGIAGGVFVDQIAVIGAPVTNAVPCHGDKDQPPDGQRAIRDRVVDHCIAKETRQQGVKPDGVVMEGDPTVPFGLCWR